MLLKPQKTNFPNTSFPIHVMPRFPQGVVGIHNHEFTEIVIVNSGSGEHYNQHEFYPIEAGDVFVISGETSHGYRNIRNLVLTNILYDESQIQIPLWDLKKMVGYHALFKIEPRLRATHSIASNLHLMPNTLKTAESIAFQLADELKDKRDGYQFYAISLLMQVIHFLSQSYKQPKTENNYLILKLARVLSFLETHYVRAITLDELTQVANLSKSSLHRAFVKAFEMSVIDYLNRLRMQKSIELMKNRDLTITDIALQTGFTDSNYFSRKFREIYGVSPKEFRQSI